MTAAPTSDTVRAVLKGAWLDEHSDTQSGFVLAAEGTTVHVTIEQADLAGRRMPSVPYLDPAEALDQLLWAQDELRKAGWEVTRVGDALVVGASLDLIDVLGGVVEAESARRAALTADQEAEEAGRDALEREREARCA